jgi:hypothetical protein
MDGGKVNIFWPKVEGQSGTDNPEFVLVTIPPAKRSKKVKADSPTPYQ